MKQTLRKILSALVALTLVLIALPSLTGHTASADTVITGVAITGIDAPAAGAKPDYTASGSGTGYYLESDYTSNMWRNGVEWYDVTTSSWLTPGTDTFIAGHQYRVGVSVKAKSGYVFNKTSSTCTINGKTAEVYAVWNSGNAGFSYTFPALPTVVSSVAITGVTEPVAGAKPVFSASADGTGYKQQNYNSASYHNGVLWRDTSNDNKVLATDDTFIAGHKYEVIVCVEPKSGYAFSDSTTGTINGKSAGKNIYTDGTATFKYTFPAVSAADTLITGVAITGIDAPAAGAKPDYTASGSGAGYYVETDYTTGTEWRNGVEWYDVTASKWLAADTDTFTAGHQYRVVVSVMAKSGYTFSKSSSTGTINGKTAEVYEVWKSDNAGFSYTFPAVQADARKIIPAVDITIKKPLPDQTPSYSATVTGEGVALNDYTFIDDVTKWEHGVNWYDRTSNSSLGRMGLDATFVQLNDYTVNVMVKAAAGYHFTSDTKVTVNGEEGKISISGDNATCSYDFYMCIPEGLQLIVTVTEPVAGQKPSYEYTLGGVGGYINDVNEGAYVHGVLWHDMAENRDMSPDDVFVAGRKYWVQLSVGIYDGYYFDRMHGWVKINDQYSSPRDGCIAVFECKAAEHLFPADFGGFAEYEGGLFVIDHGDIATDANGLVQDPHHPETWYYCANGQAQLTYTGAAQYGGQWFYLKNGVLDTSYNGLVSYDGQNFIVALGRLLTEYSGLIQDPNTGVWYFVAAGRMLQEYTGLQQYNGAWFYVVNGRLASEYSGSVQYNGSTFNVVNGQVVFA